MTEKDQGTTRNGKRITNKVANELNRKAEEGFDVDEIICRRGGRPPMGSAAATVESVRLDPELSAALHTRAKDEGRTNSDVIREALRDYLGAS